MERDIQQGVYSEFDESSDNFVDCVFVVCAVCKTYIWCWID